MEPYALQLGKQIAIASAFFGREARLFVEIPLSRKDICAVKLFMAERAGRREIGRRLTSRTKSRIDG